MTVPWICKQVESARLAGCLTRACALERNAPNAHQNEEERKGRGAGLQEANAQSIARNQAAQAWTPAPAHLPPLLTGLLDLRMGPSSKSRLNEGREIEFECGPNKRGTNP